MHEQTSATFGGNVSALGVMHTVTSANTVMLAFVSTRNSSPTPPPTVSSITFGTQALTRLTSQCPDCGNAGINNLELWVLANPAMGTSQIDATLSGSAKGAAVLVSSYVGASAFASETSVFGNGGTASIAWTNPNEGAWAVAGVMDQGGFALSLIANTAQTERSDTQCDPSDYQAANTADQRGVAANQQVAFSWTIGQGTGTNCITSLQDRNWIAIGVSIY